MHKIVKKHTAFAALPLVLALAACSPGAKETSESEKAQSESATEEGFVQIFDGQSLDGWEGDTALWRVENGILIGEITPDKLLKTNSFLIWRGGTTENFELKAEFRISETGNSGINYRSEQVEEVPHALRGYQADIDGGNRYTGQNYEERGRTTLAYQGEKAVISSQPEPEKEGSLRAHVKSNAWTMREVTEKIGEQDSLRTLIKKGDWNTCHIIANGPRLQHFINGVLISEVTDNDEVNRKLSGLLGVQVHVGPPMTVEYRNIKIKEL